MKNDQPPDPALRRLADAVEKEMLTQEEKSAMLERLLAIVDNDIAAASASAPARRRWWQRSVEFLRFPDYWLEPIPFAPVVAVVAMLVAGGIAAAAEGALPGDTLYAVKVGVNEKVRTALAFDELDLAQWTTRRAQRRLEEAERLAASGKLDMKTNAIIQSTFASHAENLTAQTRRLEADANLRAAADVASEFETLLGVHAKALEQLAAERPQLSREANSLAEQVRSALDDVRRNRTDIETRIAGRNEEGIRLSAEGKLRAAEAKIREAADFLAKKSAVSRPERARDAQERLNIAKQKTAAGRAELKAGKNEKAFVLFHEALSIAQEAKLVVAVEETLGITLSFDLAATNSAATSSNATSSDAENAAPFNEEEDDEEGLVEPEEEITPGEEEIGEDKKEKKEPKGPPEGRGRPALELDL